MLEQVQGSPLSPDLPCLSGLLRPRPCRGGSPVLAPGSGGLLLTPQMPLTEATRIQDIYHLWPAPLGCSSVSGINYCLLFTFQTWIVESMPLKHWKKFCKDDLAHIRAYPINIFSPVSPFWLNSLKVTALIITNAFKRESPLCFHGLSEQASSHSSHKAYLPTGFCSHIIQCFSRGSFVFGKFPFIESQNSVVS